MRLPSHNGLLPFLRAASALDFSLPLRERRPHIIVDACVYIETCQIAFFSHAERARHFALEIFNLTWYFVWRSAKSHLTALVGETHAVFNDNVVH